MAQRIASRLHWRRFAPGILVFLAVVYFWPFFLTGEIIAPTDLLLKFPPWSSLAPEGFNVKNQLRSDIVDGTLPNLRLLRDGVISGDLPLWTPLKAQGRPLASALQTSFFHPLTFFLTTLFPLKQGFSLLIISKLIAAGVFTYLFLRKLNVSRAGSVLGGLAYMFSGFNIVWLMWSHTLVSSFGPLLFLQVENLVRSPKLRNAILLAFVVALMVLGRFPAVAGYFFYAAGLYFVVRLAQMYSDDRNWKRPLWTIGVFSLAFVLGFAITAFQLVPAVEEIDFVDVGYRKALASRGLPVEQGIQLFFPNFFGNQVFGNFQGSVNLNESSGYIGIVTVTLAIFGSVIGLLKRRAVIILFSVLAFVCLLLIYDIGPFLGWVRHLPVFDLNPNTRLLSILGFAGAVVAAFAFDDLRRFRPRGRFQLVAVTVVAVGGFVVAGTLTYLGYEILQRTELISAFLDDFPIIEFQTFRLVTVAFGLSLALLFLILVFVHLFRPLPPLVLGVAVLVLVSADLLVFAYRQNPTVPEEYFYPETPGIRFLQTNLRPYERMAPLDGSFMIPGTQLYYGLSSSFGHSMYSQRHRELIKSFSNGVFATRTVTLPRSNSTDLTSPIIDLLGIRFLTVPYRIDLFEAAPELRVRYDMVYAAPGELRIYENKHFSPAFLVADVERLNNPEAILSRMGRVDFDPKQTAFVEEPPPAGWTAPAAQPGPTSVTVARYESDTVAYEVDTRERALLVTPELYHPGWKVRVDGEPAEIYRADYVFRSVFLDEGQHTVTFSYEPKSFDQGVIITLLALAASAALVGLDLAICWRRRGRAAP